MDDEARVSSELADMQMDRLIERNRELVAALAKMLDYVSALKAGIPLPSWAAKDEQDARAALAKVQAPNGYQRTPQQEHELEVMRSRGEL